MTEHTDNPDLPIPGSFPLDDEVAKLWRSAEPVPRRDQLAAERLVRRLQTEAVAVAERHRVQWLVRAWQIVASASVACFLVVLGLWMFGATSPAANDGGGTPAANRDANPDVNRPHPSDRVERNGSNDGPANIDDNSNDSNVGPAGNDGGEAVEQIPDPGPDQDPAPEQIEDDRQLPPMPDLPDGPVTISTGVSTGTLARMFTVTDAWVVPEAPTLKLPLVVSAETIRNHDELIRAIGDVESQQRMLEQLAQNGFAVGAADRYDDPVHFYRRALASRLPVMITVDMALHLAHSRIDATRRCVEENELSPRLRRIMRSLSESLEDLSLRFPERSQAGRAVMMARRFVAVACALQAAVTAEEFVQPAHCCCIAMRVSGPGMNYFYPEMWGALSEFNATLPLDRQVDVDGYLSGRDLRRLLDEYVSAARDRIVRDLMPDFADDALVEVHRIMAADAYHHSDACGTTVNYSVFRVPDRYTRAPVLANYWRTLQWLRQLDLPLAETANAGDNDSDDADALVRAMAGLFTADALCRVADSDSRSTTPGRVDSAWRRMIAAIDFTDGLTQSLAPFVVRAICRHCLGTDYDTSHIGRPGVAARLCRYLANTRASGFPLESGESRETMPVFFGRPDHPGDYAMARMAQAHDRASVGTPPDPMELMAALGSDRAVWLLKNGFQGITPDGSRPWEGVREEFDAMSDRERHATLSRDWLATLFTLVRPEGRDQYPAYMSTDAYSDRLLHAAMASYVRQHPDADVHMFKRTRGFDEEVEPFAHPDSTVEALPHVYASILAVVNHTRVGLDRLGMLPTAEANMLKRTEETLKRLVDMSTTLLAGHSLSADDQVWISRFPDRLDALSSGDGRSAMMAVTTIRSANPAIGSGCTRMGTGGVRPMLTLTRSATGEVVAVIGCVSSYYRVMDVDDRTPTVEMWRRDLRSGMLNSPDWTESFISER